MMTWRDSRVHFYLSCLYARKSMSVFVKTPVPNIKEKKEEIQIYHTEHKISPPTPKERASRSVKIPTDVERIKIPAPPKTRGIS